MILFGGMPDEDNSGECICCFNINVELYTECSLPQCNHGTEIGYMIVTNTKSGETVYDGPMPSQGGGVALKLGITASIKCGYHEGGGHSCDNAIYDMFIRNIENGKILNIGVVNLNNGNQDIEVGPLYYQVTKEQIKSLL